MWFLVLFAFYLLLITNRCRAAFGTMSLPAAFNGLRPPRLLVPNKLFGDEED